MEWPDSCPRRKIPTAILHLFYSCDCFFDDRIGKPSAHQSSHHEVAASGFQLFAVSAGHQRFGGFQFRVPAHFVGRVDRFQRLFDLLGAQALLPEVLGSGAAAFFRRQQSMGAGFRIALVVHIAALNHLRHHSRRGLLREAAVQPLVQDAGGQFLPCQKLHRAGAGLGSIGRFFFFRQRAAVRAGK